MFIKQIRRPNCARFCTVKKTEKKIKYTDTINLPKTAFPHHLKSKLIAERDKQIQESCGFAKLYEWQRQNVHGKEFTLLDGPPYANGRVHVGHAINKILKDVIIRSKLVRGHRITFVPGWDCHGLPIELKALEKTKCSNQNPVEIRRKAREFALDALEKQKKSFQSWGILADWENQIYHTFDKNYVIRQLQIFWNLYEKGLLYRDLKPVYWSPSTKTALAEAELIYKDHVSPGVTLRLQIVEPPSDLPNTPLHLLIWTTTPWTLPLNEAVCCSSNFEYSIVSCEHLDGLYIVASSLVLTLEEKWQKKIKVLKTLPGSSLNELKYRHPWRANENRRVLLSDHVTASGTGLVHVAPPHGHDDFLVGLKNGLTLQCHVDGEGRYTTEMGPELEGIPVLTEGSQIVVKKLGADIIHAEEYQHSYPYDWRSDKPVIIRASKQWFIDTAALKQTALESLNETAGPTERLRSLLTTRPYWCVSRQRAWGVPIPAFYHRTSSRPLLSKKIIDALCRQIRDGNSDAWWTAKDETLFPKAACEELCASHSDIERGKDIMDIWFDSGVAWISIDNKADVCLEGVDQYTGWFQSLLLTSVAVRNHAPTKCFLTHGFAVDEDGRKMSKSLGNVLDPETAVKSVGVDALRWWAASQAHHSRIPASNRLLENSGELVTRLRGTFKFLLGALNNVEPKHLDVEPLFLIDRYMLDASYNLYSTVMNSYDSFTWHKACNTLVNFTADPLSSLYLHIIKDRLYCDNFDSERRLSALAVISGIMETLLVCVAPILPHLTEEVYSYHAINRGKFWFRNQPWIAPTKWIDADLRKTMETILRVKSLVDSQVGTSGSLHFDCILHLSEDCLREVQLMQKNEYDCDSQLTELLQVASVQLNPSISNEIVLSPASRCRCPRCRRYTAATNESLCQRCQNVLLTSIE